MATRSITGLVMLLTALARVGVGPAEAAVLPVTLCSDNGTQLRSRITAATA